jgi:hypothetical protein
MLYLTQGIAFMPKKAKPFTYTDGSLVPSDVEIIQDGRKYYVNTAAGRVYVCTATAFRKRQLRYEDGTLVPADLEIKREGRTRYIKTAEGRVEVFTTYALSQRGFKHKDGTLVPADLKIMHEGCKHYIDTAEGRFEVFPVKALSSHPFKYKDGTLVPANANIIHEGQKYYVDAAAGRFEIFTEASADAEEVMVEGRESGGGKIQKSQKKNSDRADLAESFPGLARTDKRARGESSPGFFSQSVGAAQVKPSFDGEDPLVLLSASAVTATMS